MDDHCCRFGFHSTYQETWFVMRSGSMSFQVSDPIRHHQTATRKIPSIQQCFVFLAAVVKDPARRYWPQTYGDRLVCLSLQGLFKVDIDDERLARQTSPCLTLRESNLHAREKARKESGRTARREALTLAELGNSSDNQLDKRTHVKTNYVELSIHQALASQSSFRTSKAHFHSF